MLDFHPEMAKFGRARDMSVRSMCRSHCLILDAHRQLRRGEARSQVELRLTARPASQFVHVALSLSLNGQRKWPVCWRFLAQTGLRHSAEAQNYFRANAVVEEAESANASQDPGFPQAAVSHENFAARPLNAIIGFLRYSPANVWNIQR